MEYDTPKYRSTRVMLAVALCKELSAIARIEREVYQILIRLLDESE